MARRASKGRRKVSHARNKYKGGIPRLAKRNKTLHTDNPR